METTPLPLQRKEPPLTPPKEGNLESDKAKFLTFSEQFLFPSFGGVRGGCSFERLWTVKKHTMQILTTINGISIKRNFVENLPYNPKLKMLAREKRKAGIYSEVLFWQQVRAGLFYNIDFDRQRIIGNYIVDFYVKALGVVLEIDGISHENKIEYDAARQVFLESLGLKIFRVTDGAVKSNIISVMEGLKNFIIIEFGEIPLTK
jgi:very-short-patch-repair endonuclease